MKTFALLSLVVLILWWVIAFIYSRFQQTDAVRWARRLEQHVAGLNNRREQLLQPADRGEIHRVEADLYHQHLRSVSVQELTRFPGIGPGTVVRVSSRFGLTLADVAVSSFEQLPAIGPVKAKDLRDAVAKLQSEARSRFDAGACPEAIECRRRVTEIKVKYRETERALELVAVNATLAECRPLIVVARGVTFFNYFFQQTVPGLTDEILSQPFPQVQGASPTAAPVAASLAIPIPPPLARSVTSPALTKPTTRSFVLPPSSLPSASSDWSSANWRFSKRFDLPPSSPPSVSAPVASPLIVTDPFVPVPVIPPTSADLPRTATPVPSANADLRSSKLRMVVRFGLFIAKADGHVAHAERKILRDYLDQQFGHDGKLAWRIDPMIEAEEKHFAYEAEILSELKTATTTDEQQQLFALAVRIADACGQRNSREKDKLARISAAFGLSTQAPELPKAEAPPPAVKAPNPVPEPVPPAPKESTSQPPSGPSDLIGRPRAYVRLAVAAALSCGPVGPAERAIVREFLARKGQRSAATIAQYNHAIDLAVADAPSLRGAADAVRPMTSDGEKRELLELLGRIADCDGNGERSKAGAAAVAEVKAVFGIRTPGVQPRPKPKPAPSPKAPVPLVVTATSSPVIPTRTDPRTVLEIPPRAELSVELIRRRFGLLTDKLDPVKAAALGPEFAAMAERKLAEIRVAAETLIAPFGEPLDPPLKPPVPSDLRHNPDLDDAFGG